MRIVINDEELERHVLSIFKHLPTTKVLIDQFWKGQKAEIDGIYDGEQFHIMGIMEHIEPAGIHSRQWCGTSPRWPGHGGNWSDGHLCRRLAMALKIKGLINIQFAIKGEKVYVIEANQRASGTTPFHCQSI